VGYTFKCSKGVKVLCGGVHNYLLLVGNVKRSPIYNRNSIQCKYYVCVWGGCFVHRSKCHLARRTWVGLRKTLVGESASKHL
jgi:hypothetical protein